MSPDAFYMNILPCLEDLRQATFPSFEAKPDLKPEERHIAAMTTLIDDMDLSGVRPCAPCDTCSYQWKFWGCRQCSCQHHCGSDAMHAQRVNGLTCTQLSWICRSQATRGHEQSPAAAAAPCSVTAVHRPSTYGV